MVPVHVAEQDCPLVGPAVEEVGAPLEKVARQADTGARVDDQTRAHPVEGDSKTGRVSAVTDKLGPGRRHRAADAEDPHSH